VDTHTAESRRLLEALHAAGFSGAIALEAGTAAIASPMRLATEWAGFAVSTEGQRYYAKVLYEDMDPLIDVARSGRASGCAAETGAAPGVRLVDAQRGVLLFDALTRPGWKWAHVDDLTAPDRLLALWALKRKVHQGPAPDFLRSPHEDIQRLRALCKRDGVSLPTDAAWIDECVDLACAALQSGETRHVPIHGDGVASNVMIGPQGQLCLIDFDRGGCFDPWYDVATTLNDLFQFEDEWRAGVAAWAGRCEEADYARCRLYALVDDWLCTLSASWSGATSARQVEFTKLGQWTLLRCRQSVQDARFEAWLRQLHGVAS
jgi:hypothetical protein